MEFAITHKTMMSQYLESQSAISPLDWNWKYSSRATFSKRAPMLEMDLMTSLPSLTQGAGHTQKSHLIGWCGCSLWISISIVHVGQLLVEAHKAWMYGRIFSREVDEGTKSLFEIYVDVGVNMYSWLNFQKRGCVSRSNLKDVTWEKWKIAALDSSWLWCFRVH